MEEEPIQFDCKAGPSTLWSEDKQAWCCKSAGLGCPEPSAVERYNCEAEFGNWVAGWSGEKKVWCCKSVGRGCKAEEDPLDMELTTSEQPQGGLAIAAQALNHWFR